MKKSLSLLSCNTVKCALTLVVSMLFCNTMMAQPESFVVKDAAANFPENTKVRYVNDTLAVGYFDDNSKGCFMLINLNNASITHKVEIQNTNMYVRDFRVLGDTVYACGRYRFLLNQKGFIMKFNINLIRTGSNSNEYAKYVYIDSITVLNRMVVYYNSILGLNEVIAIGEGRANSSHSRARIVDCKSGSSAIYKVRRGYASGSFNEYLHDIVLTDNYIGFIGGLGGNTTMLRRARRNATDMLTGTIDTIRYYEHPDTEPGTLIYATEEMGDLLCGHFFWSVCYTHPSLRTGGSWDAGLQGDLYY